MTSTPEANEGLVAMTGLRALLQVTALQQDADARRGLRTAGLVAGYRGSPLAGVDDAYERMRSDLERRHVSFISGVNEDLAATMIWGTQFAHLEADCRYDGVFGLWYGKGPGIDRSVDALRHANLAGVDPNGGVLTVVGDDPACKSSTIPSASEGVLADLAMPTLYPGSVQEVLDMGRWAYELSRYCGSWVGLKVHTDVADQYATVAIDASRVGQLNRPDLGWTATQRSVLMAPASVAAETDMFDHRIEAARAFVASNGFDQTHGSPTAALGIVAAGKAFGDVMSLLQELGLGDEAALEDAGIRIWKPAMIWPLEPTGLASFAQGLEEIFVVEEKRAFLETQVRDLLYGAQSTPRVCGKKGPGGAALLPVDGALTADRVRPALIGRIEAVLPHVQLRKPRDRIAIIASSGSDLATRTPYFCSGCPHNRSTVLPEGSVAGGGIGCHTLAGAMERGQTWHTHMGGEGAQWAGMSQFVGSAHRFQNIGDGTLSHSGSLAIRQTVSAGTNITYKILYNGTVAMTGGQDAAGNMPIPALTQMLQAEGVVKTVVVNEDGHGYDVPLATNAHIASRDDFDAVQRDLRDRPGVTAIVYDQRCAAELRRDRKRDKVATPTKRIFINEAVCDGCGDCGRVSNCMSVHPVETVFGRKTRIHQESCNFDYSCVEGNCPAFIEVQIDPTDRKKFGLDGLDKGGPLPEAQVLDDAAILVVGIGGTGVVTVSQVLSTAALLDGKHALSLDQTGLAQKGGQVISNLKISREQRTGTARVGENEADTVLIFDVIGGTSTDVLSRIRQGETNAVVSTVLVPTGHAVRDVGLTLPGLEAFQSAVHGLTAPGSVSWLDAEGIALQIFGSQPAANFLVVGVACQRGLLPVSAQSIEAAITQNGVAVDLNIEAFRLGRRWVVEPQLLEHLATAWLAPGPPEPAGGFHASGLELVDQIEGPEALLDLLRVRVPELIAHSNRAYAASYVAVVARCRRAERVHDLDPCISEVVAHQLFKLMAYKDEYEVARLHARESLRPEIEQQFGPGATFAFLLDPPTLKRLRGSKKSAIPERAGRILFQTLARARRVRGSRLDPFGRTEERRIERALVEEYPVLVDRVLDGLRPDNAAEATQILRLADQIRGFDSVKLANVARYRADVEAALVAYEQQ